MKGILSYYRHALDKCENMKGMNREKNHRTLRKEKYRPLKFKFTIYPHFLILKSLRILYIFHRADRVNIMLHQEMNESNVSNYTYISSMIIALPRKQSFQSYLHQLDNSSHADVLMKTGVLI